MLLARRIRQTHAARNPRRPAARHLGDASRRSVVVCNIISAPATAAQMAQPVLSPSWRPSVKYLQPIPWNLCIAPKPVHPPPVNCVLHRVAAQHSTFLPVACPPRLVALAKQPRPGRSPQPPRVDWRRHLNLMTPSCLHYESRARLAEPVLGHFVTLPPHVEPDFFTHQFRQIERHHPCVVRHERHAIFHPQFHQRHHMPSPAPPRRSRMV